MGVGRYRCCCGSGGGGGDGRGCSGCGRDEDERRLWAGALKGVRYLKGQGS